MKIESESKKIENREKLKVTADFHALINEMDAVLTRL